MEETPPFEPDPPSSVETSSDESDDDLAFFKSLADD